MLIIVKFRFADWLTDSFLVDERKLLKMALTACHRLQKGIIMKNYNNSSCGMQQSCQFLTRLQGAGLEDYTTWLWVGMCHTGLKI